MKWGVLMGQVLRMIFGIPPSRDKQDKSYEIKHRMINPDVVRMDMNSFRSSKKVQAQATAARKAYENSGIK